MYEYAYIFVNNFFKFCIIRILYNAIMNNCRFVQTHCKDLLKMILKKFSFLVLYFIYYDF
jgi:hypothetical protein